MRLTLMDRGGRQDLLGRLECVEVDALACEHGHVLLEAVDEDLLRPSYPDQGRCVDAVAELVGRVCADLVEPGELDDAACVLALREPSVYERALDALGGCISHAYHRHFVLRSG